MNNQLEMDDYFNKGFDAFNNQHYYDAHEHWEDLWTNYYFKDRLFIQGLIQVSVGYFHITNLNLKGANGLFTKCLPKLEKFLPENMRIENLPELVDIVSKAKICVNEIETAKEFNWDLVVKLKRKVNAG